MPEWTEEQRAAIALRGASVVVSAAAGSGKTAVLVERACRLLSTPGECPAERTVIVTFANDAARELKIRLSARLREMAASDPKNPWLRRQRAMLAGMKISTIHSFCNDLLRGWGTKLGISPSFRVIEDEEEQLLRTQTAEEILEEAAHKAREDEAFAERYAALQSAFCKGADDTELRDRILDVYSAAMNRPFGLELFRERLGDEDAVLRAASSLILVRLQDAEILDTRALEVINAFGDPKKASVGNAQNILEEELRAIENMRGALERADYGTFCRVLERFRPVKGQKSDAFKPTLPKDFKSEEKSAKGMRGQAKETLKKLAEAWLAPFENARTDLPRHTGLVRTLFEMVEVFAERLDGKKREKEVIGFDDALQLTVELVAERDPLTGAFHKTDTAREISAQYDFLMIDEFQDADNKQDLIFRMLSREGSEERFGRNLFVVGDSKQSIYAFRAANPENFYRAMEQSTLYDPATAPNDSVRENTLVHLNRNFRSRGEIIEFVNAVFEPLMSRAVGEIDYDEHHRLVQGARYPEADCPVELAVLRFGGRGQAVAQQAEMIADRIAYHLDAQTPVTDSGGTRPCEPGDFLVVARRNDPLKAVAAALRRRGIAAVGDERAEVLDSEEVRWLLDCLRVIDNPRLDIPMAAVMLSPVMGFTLDEVVRLRLAGRKEPLFRVLAKVCFVNERAANPDEAEALREIRSDEALMGKCLDFVMFIKEMRLRAAMDTPEALIRRVLAERDFEGLARAMDDGERRKANLRVLPGLAKKFSDDHGGGLSDFLRHLDRMRGSALSPKSPASGSGSPGAVSLMTIHGSKGLEAPFVIPAFLNTPFSTRSKEFLFDDETGFGTCYYDKETLVRVEPLPHAAIAQKKLAAERSEEMRLLYVALTRARERLILPIVKYQSAAFSEKLNSWCALAKSLGGDMTILARAANSMQDWLLQALLCNRGAEALREEMDVFCHRFLDTEPVRVTVVPYEDPEEELFDEEFADETFSDDFPAEEAKEPAMVDEALLAKISAACSNTLPRVSLMAKYGVSELSKTEEFSAPLRSPAFSRERKGLTGAERGTALHTFLQFADFSRAREDIPAEARRLFSMGRLSQKQMEACADANLEAFFESPLFARIANAQTVCRERKFTVRMCDLRLEGEYRKLAEDYAGTDGMLIGVVDLFFEEDGEIVLVDYKSDYAKDADTLRERYTEQLALYAAAIELIRGQKVKEKLIYSLRLCQAIPV